MSQANTFGRRQPAAARAPSPKSRATPAGAAAARERSALDLDPRAEAFRAELAAGRPDDSTSFAHWRRSQDRRLWLVRALTVLSFAPGALSMVFDAPFGLSIALEVAALVANIWIRRERFRRRREILAWEDPASADR